MLDGAQVEGLLPQVKQSALNGSLGRIRNNDAADGLQGPAAKADVTCGDLARDTLLFIDASVVPEKFSPHT